MGRHLQRFGQRSLVLIEGRSRSRAQRRKPRLDARPRRGLAAVGAFPVVVRRGKTRAVAERLFVSSYWGGRTRGRGRPCAEKAAAAEFRRVGWVVQRGACGSLVVDIDARLGTIADFELVRSGLVVPGELSRWAGGAASSTAPPRSILPQRGASTRWPGAGNVGRDHHGDLVKNGAVARGGFRRAPRLS